MDTMEKFYSDASRLVEKLNKDGDTAAFDARLTEIFCKAVLLYNKQAQVLANDFADYWLSTYSEGRQKKKMLSNGSIKYFLLLQAILKKTWTFRKKTGSR